MGCWNATCQLSNLPIFEGEEVAAVVIAFSDEIAPSGNTYLEDHSCYALSYPIYGTYNDYGGLNYEPQISVDILYKEIYDNLNDSEKKSHYSKSFYRLHRGKDSEKYSLSLEYATNNEILESIGNKNFLETELPNKNSFINDLIERDEIVMKLHGKIFRIGLVLIKKDILDSMLSSASLEEQFKEINEAFNQYPIVKEFNIENATKEELIKNFMEADKLNDYFRCIGGSSKKKEYFQNKIREFKESFNYSSEEASKILLKELQNLLEIQTIMSELRKSWLPTSGKGHQDYDGFEKYKALIEAMTNSIKKTEASFDDWED